MGMNEEHDEENGLLDEEIGQEFIDEREVINDSDAFYDEYMDDAFCCVADGVRGLQEATKVTYPLAFKNEERFWKMLIAAIPNNIVVERATLFSCLEHISPAQLQHLAKCGDCREQFGKIMDEKQELRDEDV